MEFWGLSPALGTGFLVFFAFEWEAMDEQAEKSRVEEAGKAAHHSGIWPSLWYLGVHTPSSAPHDPC